jgi:hypothetical protein
MRKKRKSRTLLFLGSAGILTAYIGSQLKSVKKRYEVEEKTIDCPNYWLEQLPTDMNIKNKEQRNYHFSIVRKVDKHQVGTCILYFGQEETSYYGGHIVIVPVSGENEKFKKEVLAALIHLSKEKMMSHLYFVADKKDAALIQEIEELGAKFTKDISIPETHRNYVQKQKKIKQYKLLLSD